MIGRQTVLVLLSLFVTNSVVASVCFTFEPANTFTPSAALGDLNNDGYQDRLYINNLTIDMQLADEAGALSTVQQNMVAATYPDSSSPGSFGIPTSSTIGDINNDGFNDAVYALGSYVVIRKTNNSALSFYGGSNYDVPLDPDQYILINEGFISEGNENYTALVKLADINSDDFPDLVVAHETGVSIFINDNTGFFDTRQDVVTGVKSFSIQMASFYKSEYPDILLQTQTGVLLFENITGVIDAVPRFSFPYNILDQELASLKVVDVDGDNDLDIFIIDEQTSLLINNTENSVTISEQVFNSSYGAVLEDIDADGDVDVAPLLAGSTCSSGLLYTGSTWRNDGNGNFEEVPGNPYRRGGRVGDGFYELVDFDGDGYLDIFNDNRFIINNWLRDYAVQIRNVNIDLNNDIAIYTIGVTNNTDFSIPIGFRVDFSNPDELTEYVDQDAICAPYQPSSDFNMPSVKFIDGDLIPTTKLFCGFSQPLQPNSGGEFTLRFDITSQSKIFFSVEIPTNEYGINRTPQDDYAEDIQVINRGTGNSRTSDSGGGNMGLLFLTILLIWVGARSKIGTPVDE